MIVDDNVNMRAICKQFIRSFGAREMHEAADGDEALKLLNHTTVDILITDWEMRPMDGIELADNIRNNEDSPNQFMPIIMMTAYSSMTNVQKARDTGINEYLCKPVSALSLYKRIEEVITRPRQFVKAANYFGPDRQRHFDESYEFSEKNRRSSK